ncbi:hypothetical protein FSP39_006102 [Pinctada imbricata]|uniref:G-protein coupled receptors family 1 profile domain-containing protein n=1 Tax=Pinctada imbricata TaxID=66713 RepID=A0AA89BNR3_PINIB|nr:hypothetical protein FSP39_006102 [Pinctada imbricata]
MEMNNTISSDVVGDVTLSIHNIEYQVYLQKGQWVVLYLALLCVIGTIGNAHVLLVFPRKYSTSNFKIFIIAMAVNDILACILTIPFEIIDERYLYTYNDVIACKTFRFLSYFLTILSGFLLLLVAVERFRKICRPFGVQMTRKKVYATFVALIILALALATPNIIFQNINNKDLPDYPGVTGTNCGAMKTKFSSLYYGCLLLISTLVLVSVVVIYGVILRTVWRHRKSLFLTTNRDSANLSLSDVRLSAVFSDAQQNGATGCRESFTSEDDGPMVVVPCSNSRPSSVIEVKQNPPNKLHRAVRNTMMFMVASFISYCGIIPVIVLGIIRNADPTTYDVIKRHLGVFMTILVRGFFFNNVVNPYVYCFMDGKFRKECKQLYINALKFISNMCKEKKELS